MTACGYPLCLIFTVLFLGMVFLCLTMCLGGFTGGRRHWKKGWCRGPGAGGRDEDSLTGRK